jgi:hypothetical protein
LITLFNLIWYTIKHCHYCLNPNPYQTLAYRKKWLIQQVLWVEPPEPEPEPEPEPKPEPVVIQERTEDPVYEEEFEEGFNPTAETYPEEAKRQVWLEHQGLVEEARYIEEQEELFEEPSPELQPVVEDEDNKEAVNAEQDVKKDDPMTDVVEEAAVESKEKDDVENSTGKKTKGLYSMFSQVISRTLSLESAGPKPTNLTEEDQTQPVDTVPAKEANTPPAKPTTSSGSAVSVNTLDTVEPVVENDIGDDIPKPDAQETVDAAHNQASVAADTEAEVQTEEEGTNEMTNDYVVTKDEESRDAKIKERRAKKKERRFIKKKNGTSKKFYFF